MMSGSYAAHGGLTDEAVVLGRLGPLEVRLATQPDDIRDAQRLRYDVFYEEGRAIAAQDTQLLRRDCDAFDAVCDHLLVIDTTRAHHRSIVGTYRLLRRDIAAQHFGFYSESEFDIAPMLARHPQSRLLELGRSCVLKPYRDKRTVELLWHGIWTYVRRHRIDAMFGCASFDGTDPDAIAEPLSFLARNALAQEEWRIQARDNLYLAMERMHDRPIDIRRALHAMPPLIKGYLRLGAKFGEGAVIDRTFNTIDVLVILPVNDISQRYISHFGADAERHAA
ncbi:MAG: GNAT family N-acetyltransferase [Beijerinckiaceae bacterium]|nr:GNAT family N-acetyltransferase [Beijerinckiaceae bacterium]